MTSTTDPLACVLCSKTDATVAVRGGLTICSMCYESAFAADMQLARVYTFSPADHVCDNIFLGPEGATIDEAWLHEHKIDRVLTVAAHSDHLAKHDSITYKQIAVDDSPDEELRPFFEEASAFISAQRETNCLVHCVSGISRSATIVIAHLMMTKQLPYPDALALVRTRRPVASPNSGFQRQLERFGEELRGGVVSAQRLAAAPRTVFISLSALLRHPWPSLAADPRLPTALFFFGSKRRWVFPTSEAERQESADNNPAYLRMAPQMRECILRKESEGLVFWLKPDEFAYDGGLYSGDPSAFARASAWLEGILDPTTGTAYRPLQLDPAWWAGQGPAGGGFDAASAVYTADVDAIVRNLRNGAHDYGPVCELLVQSNPNLKPATSLRVHDGR